MSGPRGNRLAGHTLPYGGRVMAPGGYLVHCVGAATCSCGEVSPPPVLSGTAERKAWHRAHKDDIRAGGDGKVRQGDKP